MLSVHYGLAWLLVSIYQNFCRSRITHENYIPQQLPLQAVTLDVLVQGGEILPELPEQAQYVQNECFDWGTYGWVLKLINPLQLSTYTYFVFLNSSIRGPFLPLYWPVSCKESATTVQAAHVLCLDHCHAVRLVLTNSM